MTNASLVLIALTLVGAAACRPTADRTDATQTGAVTTSGPPAARRSGDPVAKGAEKVTPETLPRNLAEAPPEPDGADTGTDNEVSNSAEANLAEPAPAPVIPARFRGRWGLVPADCTSTRGDAKGLIRIGERTIRFYESTATLRERLPGSATSFGGDFGFTGEGMTWEKAMTLMRTGDTLTRTQDGQSFAYKRCM